MRLPLLAAAVSLSLLAGGLSPAIAAPCKDAKGKFIKCPPPAPVAPAKGVRCKNKGKFAKCGTPGAVPIK